MDAVALIQTLTTLDALWLNQRITGGRNAYHYARLEEAVFLQYSHGREPDPVRQAARVLAEFAGHRPLSRANLATGVALALAFLVVNGFTVAVGEPELLEAVPGFRADRQAAETWLRGQVRPGDGHEAPSVAEAMGSVVARYSGALAALDQAEGETPAAVVSAPRLSGEFVGG
jgi:prophage maintenance system killer protein